MNKTMEYLVTHCPTHGLKVARNEVSAKHYRFLARDYKAWADAHGYTGDYYDAEGVIVSDWACCSDMRVGTDSDVAPEFFVECGHPNAGLRGPNGECWMEGCR